MASKEPTEQNGLDTVKLAAALLVLVAGLIAFYYYANVSKLLRVGGIIAAAGVAAAIALQTAKGRQLAGFTREAQIEVRKVVWPTRQETTQTTLIVIMVVIIFALLLWVLDLILSGLVQMLIGRDG